VGMWRDGTVVGGGRGVDGQDPGVRQQQEPTVLPTQHEPTGLLVVPHSSTGDDVWFIPKGTTRCFFGGTQCVTGSSTVVERGGVATILSNVEGLKSEVYSLFLFH